MGPGTGVNVAVDDPTERVPSVSLARETKFAPPIGRSARWRTNLLEVDADRNRAVSITPELTWNVLRLTVPLDIASKEAAMPNGSAAGYLLTITCVAGPPMLSTRPSISPVTVPLTPAGKVLAKEKSKLSACAGADASMAARVVIASKRFLPIVASCAVLTSPPQASSICPSPRGSPTQFVRHDPIPPAR